MTRHDPKVYYYVHHLHYPGVVLDRDRSVLFDLIFFRSTPYY